MLASGRALALLLLPLALLAGLPAGKARAQAETEAPGASRPGIYATRTDAMRLAVEIAERRDLDPDWVRRAIGQAVFLRQVPRLMLPPARGTTKNWRSYRNRFVNAARIRAGTAFWQRNRAVLERAQTQFGVPASIIVGIIGVETIYGQNTGNIRVIDALTTLSFDFPDQHSRAAERQAFFRSELEQFLTLCDRIGMDPLAPLGSYAGAMGLPQFMPSSWRRWAIDFDDDGRIDLWDSEADAIGSVASYFQAHGWQPGQPTHFAVQLAPEVQLDVLLAPDILPTFTPTRMAALGAALDTEGRTHAGSLALVELENGNAEPSYVAGTENFYAITRYNQSSYYAMAVIELGAAVAAVLRR